ncbi:hypothetical protein C2845_PM17G10550 [Panicum miliaceum]|uniref:Uncharacterized protein n=1 Tax=Panicum miliaceum TaxID=4540 RepID=A0A3L6Q3W9_PANMI|nr:hypothetical protein C2845_PM17G10550 [Panicum miliaceum]
MTPRRRTSWVATGECGAFEPGDIVRLTGGMFSYHRGNALVLRAGRRGHAEKVGEFTMLFVETPNMSEIHWGRDPSDPRRMVQEAIVSPYSRSSSRCGDLASSRMCIAICGIAILRRPRWPPPSAPPHTAPPSACRLQHGLLPSAEHLKSGPA